MTTAVNGYAIGPNANLYGADLQGADLRSANLQGADLRRANLQGADLQGAKNLSALVAARLSIVPVVGAFIGFKKCFTNIGGSVIVKLLIPARAKRSNGTERKCRASFVKVLALSRGTIAYSTHDAKHKLEYRPGKIVRAHEFCEDRWRTCAGGIHFYLTPEEAEAH